MNIYSTFNSLKLVIYLIKEINKTISNNKISQWEKAKLIYILKVETNIVINSITVIGIKTLLNIASMLGYRDAPAVSGLVPAWRR